jgi:hypothetical protein
MSKAGLIAECRLLVAEVLLSWAERIAPKSHLHGRQLSVAVLAYFCRLARCFKDE